MAGLLDMAFGALHVAEWAPRVARFVRLTLTGRLSLRELADGERRDFDTRAKDKTEDVTSSAERPPTETKP